MILNEIITEAEYEFLKLWYSCELMVWDEYPESLFMVRNKEVLFEQDWKNGFLWCRYYTVWSFFESKFGYNKLQISQMISGLLEEHLKNGVLTPLFSAGIHEVRLEEHLKNGVLTPTIHHTVQDLWLEEHLKNGVLTPIGHVYPRPVKLEEHLENKVLTPKKLFASFSSRWNGIKKSR